MCLSVKVCVLDKVEYLSSWLEHFWTLHIFILMLGCQMAVQQQFVPVKLMPGGAIEHLEQLHQLQSLCCTFKVDLYFNFFFFVKGE